MECSPGSPDAQHKLGGAVRSFLGFFDHFAAQEIKAYGSYMFAAGVGGLHVRLARYQRCVGSYRMCKGGPEQSLIVERAA